MFYKLQPPCEKTRNQGDKYRRKWSLTFKKFISQYKDNSPLVPFQRETSLKADLFSSFDFIEHILIWKNNFPKKEMKDFCRIKSIEENDTMIKG